MQALTGCSGRIGQGVAAALVSAGHAVRGIDTAPPPQDDGTGWVGEVEWHRLDLQQGTASEELRRLLMGVEVVIHLAAVPDDAPFVERLLPVNVIGLYNVIEACRQSATVRRVLVASSGKIFYGYGYGEDKTTDALPLRADTPPRPVCWYGATKLFAEAAAQVLAASSDKQVIAVRFAWCPRTATDVESIKACGSGAGIGTDEYLSPADAGRFCLAFCTSSLPADFSFATLACCSRSPGVQRWDMREARELLGWEPQDVFPSGVEGIVADNCRGYTGTTGLFSHFTARPS